MQRDSEGLAHPSDRAVVNGAAEASPPLRASVPCADPMEILVGDALASAGICFVQDGTKGENTQGLDFHLTGRGVYVEVKRFHSERIASQMSRAPNVIAVQGEEAVRFFCELIRASQCD